MRRKTTKDVARRINKLILIVLFFRLENRRRKSRGVSLRKVFLFDRFSVQSNTKRNQRSIIHCSFTVEQLKRDRSTHLDQSFLFIIVSSRLNQTEKKKKKKSTWNQRLTLLQSHRPILVEFYPWTPVQQ